MKHGFVNLIRNFNQDSEGFHKVPIGTTIQRPINPEEGMIRYNTSTQRYEGYFDGAWFNLITELDLAPQGFDFSSIPPGENVTRFILQSVLQQLEQTHIGSIILGVGNYATNPTGGVYAPTVGTPSWINYVSGPLNLNSLGSRPEEGDNFITGFTTDGIYNIFFDIDVASLAGIENVRYDYRYTAFSSVFYIFDFNVATGNFIYETQMIPKWSNDINDPNYGVFSTKITQWGLASSAAVGVRFFTNVFRYKNFGEL